MNRLKPGAIYTRFFNSAAHTARLKLLTEPAIDQCINSFWLKQLSLVNRPSALNLINLLVPSNSLGYPGATESVRSGSLTSKLRIVDLATGWKRMHPEMVLLVRLGDFYEAWGIDAVMLVQYAGLNPMGDSCRAGCPKGNIQQTLNALTESGFSVAVYEEANIAGSRSIKVRKERYLSQIVTPGRPLYLYETSLREGELPYLASKPYVAIKCSPKIGCSVAFVHLDSGEIRVTENVAPEALGSIIDSVGGVADPVYLCSEQTSLRVNNVTQKRFSPSLSFEAFLTAATTELTVRLGVDSSRFRRIVHTVASTVQPLHANASQFLGIVNSSPSLIHALVPRESPFHIHQFFRNWLLSPPSESVIVSMRSVLSSLVHTDLAVPIPVVVPVDKLVRLITSRNGNVHFFLDLVHAAESYSGAPSLVRTEPDVWTVVNYLSGVSKRTDIVEGVSNVDKSIRMFIDLNVEEGTPQTNSSELSRMIRNNESIFFKILGDFSNLVFARTKLIAAIKDSLIDPEKSLKYDALSQTLYVKEVSISMKLGKKKSIPNDSRKRFSTDLILAAEQEYLIAVEAARDHAKARLNELSDILEKEMETLVALSHWAVFVSSALAHAKHGMRHDWTIPIIGERTRMEKLWPFWLSQSTSMLNSMELTAGTPAVLTAPNESGKSTLLRSVGAAVWLGTCGLLVPASSMTLAPITRLLVVSPTGDRPLEGMSAFAAEAEAMASALRALDASAVLLVDEFGRGTSGRDATALSEAVLEWLGKNRANVATVWATHLHELFNRVDNVKWIQMDSQYQLIEGQCIDSQGIATARDRGFPIEICLAATEAATKTKRKSTSAVKKSTHKTPIQSDMEELLGGAVPPPKVTHALYMLRFGDKYYVGETQNLAQRVKAHTKRFGASPDQAWYAAQPNRGSARRAETDLINKCMQAGVPLLSTVDGNHI